MLRIHDGAGLGLVLEQNVVYCLLVHTECQGEGARVLMQCIAGLVRVDIHVLLRHRAHSVRASAGTVEESWPLRLTWRMQARLLPNAIHVHLQAVCHRLP